MHRFHSDVYGLKINSYVTIYFKCYIASNLLLAVKPARKVTLALQTNVSNSEPVCVNAGCVYFLLWQTVSTMNTVLKKKKPKMKPGHHICSF